MQPSEYKIMLVDDDPDIIEFLGYNLQKEGFVINTARNGKEAIAKIEQDRPDLILLDLSMPTMNGKEMINYLKNNLIPYDL